MTKSKLRRMIAIQESLLERAIKMLNERFDELEAHEVTMDWLEEYLKQQRILDWLKEQETED